MLAAGATGLDLFVWTRQHRLLPTCPIGQHRGKKWADVPHDFLTWILSKPDMNADFTYNAARELDRRDTYGAKR